MNAARPARFITLEGGEGAGKSTQAKLLSQSLDERGIENIVTREPGGSPGAEDIRKLLVEGEPGRWDALTETLLMFAARRDHVERTIRPALESGKWVICDRFTDSTLAYQGAGRGLELDAIRQLERLTMGAFKPDLTIVLDVPVAEGLARVADRRHAESRFEKFDIGFHQRLLTFFREAPGREPERCVMIGGSAPRDDVRRCIWATVSARFGL